MQDTAIVRDSNSYSSNIDIINDIAIVCQDSKKDIRFNVLSPDISINVKNINEENLKAEQSIYLNPINIYVDDNVNKNILLHKDDTKISPIYNKILDNNTENIINISYPRNMIIEDYTDEKYNISNDLDNINMRCTDYDIISSNILTIVVSSDNKIINNNNLLEQTVKATDSALIYDYNNNYDKFIFQNKTSFVKNMIKHNYNNELKQSTFSSKKSIIIDRNDNKYIFDNDKALSILNIIDKTKISSLKSVNMYVESNNNEKNTDHLVNSISILVENGINNTGYNSETILFPISINVENNLPVNADNSNISKGTGLNNLYFTIELLSFFEIKLKFDDKQVKDIIGLPQGTYYKDDAIKGSPQQSGLYPFSIKFKDDTVMLGIINVPTLKRDL